MLIADRTSTFAEDVREGLSIRSQKELPSKYFYDEVGSALFEAISVLPEYGLTRADTRILERHAGAIVARIPSPVVVAELGSGSGKKTRWILEALARRQSTTYYPIEISAAALQRCERELGHLTHAPHLTHVSIVGFESEYLEGLLEVTSRRRPGERVLLLFLGSSIGNFDRRPAEDFLKKVRHILLPGDGLLLGTDLEKPLPQLIRAYDDPAGVTAAFNLNLLARINRELEGDFDLSQFEHVALYNSAERRIEMHLRSLVKQAVTILKAGFSTTLLKDETIWTESSHKFTRHEVTQIAENTGFTCDAQWVDGEWPFVESLLIAE